MGGDLGGAVKNFKDAMNGEGENKPAAKKTPVRKPAARKSAAKTVKKTAPRKTGVK